MTSISEVETMTLHNKNNSIINNYNIQTLCASTTFIAYWTTTNNLADYLDLPCVIFFSADLKKITFFRFNYQKVFRLNFFFATIMCCCYAVCLHVFLLAALRRNKLDYPLSVMLSPNSEHVRHVPIYYIISVSYMNICI